jgi:hypothetical protein
MHTLSFQRLVEKHLVIQTSIFLVLAACLVLVGHSSNVYAATDLDVKVSIKDEEIERGDTQKVTVTVSDEDDDTNNRVSDADVKLTVYLPESDSTKAEDETDGDGEAKFNVKIDDDAEVGKYDVEVKVSKKGYDTATQESSFDVVKSSNDDDDDDDDDESENGDRHDEGSDSDGNAQDQTVSQGNACGNGFLSNNVLCQNLANQISGDGNAINIIGIQSSGNDKVEESHDLWSPSSAPSGSSITPEIIKQETPSPSGPASLDSTDSIVDQYVQLRINKALEARLNYLR